MGLLFEKELGVKLFAGGGGASTGIARAYREPVSR
jgi:DNA (cytosine-5)-methyltransferase 1